MSADWAYAIGQGVAGAAASGVHSIDQAQKEELDNRAANRDLDIKERLLAAQQQLQYQADDRKTALAQQRGQAITAGATGLLNSKNSSYIDAQFGSHIDPNDPDSKASLDAIAANPAAQAAYKLTPPSDLDKAKMRGDAARNLGYLPEAAEEDKNVNTLRKATADEAKDTREQNRLDEAARHNEASENINQLLAKAKIDSENRLALVQEKILGAQEIRAKSADARAQEQAQREMRLATKNALDSATSDVRALRAALGNPLNIDRDPQTKGPGPKARALQMQLDSAMADEARYRKALAGSGVDLGEDNDAQSGPAATGLLPSGSAPSASKRPPIGTFDQ